MPTCFVIQPFDGEAFDRRYESDIKLAIKDAGLEPYRVDQDPSADDLIESIENGIRRAAVCVADISLDKPNVWYEVGFAYAAKRQVVLMCARSRRSSLPFDIQSRNVIQYDTESSGDLVKFRASLTERLRSAMVRRDMIADVAELPQLSPIHGLRPHELGLLAIVATQCDASLDGAPVYSIKSDMANAGYADLAVTLGLDVLVRRGLVSRSIGENGSEQWPTVLITKDGLAWLQENIDSLELRRPPETPDLTNDFPF